MKDKNKFIYYLTLFFQGILIGTGAILPGVSGGVMCVAFGIYEPMMELLAHPIKSIRKHYKFFIPIAIGGLLGFVLLARLVEIFLSASEASAIMLFVGLICGTVPGLFKKAVKERAESGWGCFVVVLVASFILFNVLESGITETIRPNFFWYVFCGAVWGLSMIVPGLSSSSILLFMGLYQPMTEGIGTLDFGVILPLVLGFAVTLVSLSKAVEYLLRKKESLVFRVILGFVVSSTLMITPTSFGSIGQLGLSTVCFVVGFVIAFLMDRARKE